MRAPCNKCVELSFCTKIVFFPADDVFVWILSSLSTDNNKNKIQGKKQFFFLLVTCGNKRISAGSGERS